MGKPTAQTPPTTAVAYYRVSSVKQGQSGLGLEAQRATVEAYAKSHGLSIIAEYTEVETGTSKRKRTEIYKALALAKERGSVLLIAKLDRLARNVHFISGLMESKVPFVCCDMESVTPLTLHVLAAVAEAEAQMISARTKAALKAAKARGVKMGKPANLTPQAQAKSAKVNRENAANAYRSLAANARRLQDAGKSYAEIAATLNAEGNTTRNGKPLTPMTVWRMLKRAE